MRKILLSAAIAAITAFTANAQIVNIPDPNFKAYLVGNVAINTNSDSEIQVSEAQAFTGFIFCGSLGITSLTGIEAFTALTSLNCNSNLITNLDVSNNLNLQVLNCAGNQLTSLNVNSNTALTHLICSWNNITTLDVSNNTALTHLECDENQLTSLDLSNNIALQQLRCNQNHITAIDVSLNTALTVLKCEGQQNFLTSLNAANGNNTNFGVFTANNNANLTCIQVDNAAYSTANWTAIDATASFSENCSGTTGITEANTNNFTAVYPNPANAVLNVCVKENTNIRIVNVLGATVATQKLNAGNNTVDVSNLTNGVYFISNDGNGVVKFVKE